MNVTETRTIVDRMRTRIEKEMAVAQAAKEASPADIMMGEMLIDGCRLLGELLIDIKRIADASEARALKFRVPPEDEIAF